MWTRAELKTRAKEAFKRNYKAAIIVALVLTLIAGGNSNGSSNNKEKQQVSVESYTENTAKAVAENAVTMATGSSALAKLASMMVSGTVFLIGLVITAGLLLISVLVFNALEVGGCKFFIENAFEKAPISRLLFGFQNGFYKKITVTMFLRNLYTFLWSLLFIAPGIVKSYEYRMVSYLLADCPELSTKEAFELSKKLMNGQKWEAFVLDLSFIGWNLLNGFTFGLLGAFFVNPYRFATNAELFLTLKQNYFSTTGQGAEM